MAEALTHLPAALQINAALDDYLAACDRCPTQCHASEDILSGIRTDAEWPMVETRLSGVKVVCRPDWPNGLVVFE